MRENGLKKFIAVSLGSNLSEPWDALEIQKLIAKGEITAVVCANDLTAIAVNKICRKSGVCVPESLSIIGVDDIVESKLMDPPLTTMRIPKKEMGEKAAELILKLINGEDILVSRIEFNATMVERKSVKELVKNEPEN